MSEPPQSPKPENPRNGEFWRLMTRYSSVITLIPASAVAGYLIGYGLDYLFAARYLRVVFLILGVVAGFIQLFRDLNRDIK